jgi:hypothetical protein
VLTAKALLYRFRLLLILIVAGLCGHVVAKRIQPIALAQSEPAGHSTYGLRLKEPVPTNRIFPSQILLIDPSGDESTYTPRAASVEEIGRGLVAVSQKEWLIFSRPDGFDARDRNASAKLITPEVFPAGQATWLTLLC